MATGKPKTPKSKSIPAPSKTPKSNFIQSSNDENPSWRFSKLELVAPFGWHTIQTKLLHDIREKLKHFESMTWQEITVVAKKQNHSIPVNKICKSAQIRLKELGLDDIESLISLRMTGEQRIWGIRQKSVLLLLWWDPNHQVYPSQKKHT